MDIIKLLKFLPMLIMIASLAYAIYSMQSVRISPEPASRKSSEKQASVKGPHSEVAAPRAKTTEQERSRWPRDPFQVASRTASANVTKDTTGGSSASTEVDPYPGMIQGFTLSATFIQGKTEIAIINGRIYEKGQRISGAGDEPLPLTVAGVLAKEVILQAGSNRYMLPYRDRWSEGSASTRRPANSGARQLAMGSKGTARDRGSMRTAMSTNRPALARTTPPVSQAIPHR
jgi:hypothetical protein